ncbi:sulfotransferase family protein [Hydrogenivirga caldilitoris]|uniref:Sulfotransferase family protein n=1 Tax=Hydrogenivirga caldilitoris TaxID=246264 RepID=A0A497XN99_9AQUI|nr:sulfotransferase [Hydrogenivirga caldilitoris]RLJ70436.1 sulfotransferase family protein [Hydrogenivirga caldilitoris]
MKNKIKVIYIAGEGRSGSTLLERILGQHPDIFAAGELIHIWERSFIENQLCSCGKSFSDCDVWQRITENFVSNIKTFEPKEIIKAIENTSRMRHYLLGKNLKNKDSVFLNDVYYNLYNAIKRYTNKDFIIDASKHPVFAHILTQNTKINLYVIHLIRDARGVAYSWNKKKIRPEIIGKIEYMPRYSIFRSAIYWNLIKKVALNLKGKTNYIQIRYEDLVKYPEKTLKEIFNFLGVKNNLDNFVDRSNGKVFVNLQTNHTVSGNPFRFKTGNVELKPDQSWQNSFPFYKKFIVTLLTYPYLKKFGYIK